jgi:cyclophilin family peptidyl-prolyl cis-trans isomerase
MTEDSLEVWIMTVSKQLRVLSVLGLLAVTIPAGLARAVDPNEFKADLVKISYVVGTRIASQILGLLKSQDVQVNMPMFIKGLQETLSGQASPFTAEEQQKFMAPWDQAQEAKVKAKQEEARARQQEMAKQRAKQEEEALAKLGKENEWKLKLTKPEQRQFDANKDYFWVLETNKGTIKIKLMPQVAPMHVSSTMFLTEKGFYDGTIFHRVIPDFMAQGGDPVGDGRHGPGYQYAGEFAPNVKHDRPYLLSMANAGPDTDGSQFFITFKPTPWLDGKHTIFGEVVEGQDTVKKLEAAGSPTGKTTEELKIVKAKIEEKAKG